MAASFASAPLLQKKHLPAEAALGQRFGQRPCASMYQVFGTWISLADLLPHRLDHPRRAMAEQVAAPARKEIEVAVALGVPDRTSLRRAPARPGNAL